MDDVTFQTRQKEGWWKSFRSIGKNGLLQSAFSNGSNAGCCQVLKLYGGQSRSLQMNCYYSREGKSHMLCLCMGRDEFVRREKETEWTALCRSSRKVNHNLPWAPWKFATVMPTLIARIRYRLCCEITSFLLSKTTPQKLTWMLYLVLHHHSLYSALNSTHPNP